MKQVLLLSLIISALFIGGCDSLPDSMNWDTLNSTKSSAMIECFSGGQLIYTMNTRGKVKNIYASGSFSFTDTNGRFVEINADCIITY